MDFLKTLRVSGSLQVWRQEVSLDLNWDQAAIRDRYCPIDSIFTNSQSEMVDCLERTLKHYSLWHHTIGNKPTKELWKECRSVDLPICFITYDKPLLCWCFQWSPGRRGYHLFCYHSLPISGAGRLVVNAFLKGVIHAVNADLQINGFALCWLGHVIGHLIVTILLKFGRKSLHTAL